MKREIRLPKHISDDLAEFLGILAGDGYIGKYPKHCYVIEICGHSEDDKEYLLNHVKPLIIKLFNLSPKVYFRKDQKTLILNIRSKKIFYFIKELGFPVGKKGQIKVPNCINEDNMRFFIMGLADTDFSLCLKNRSHYIYPVVSTKLLSKPLIESTAFWLSNNGLRPLVGKKQIKKDSRGYRDSVIYALELNGTKKLQKWMELISFRNPKHLKKYKKWESHFCG